MKIAIGADHRGYKIKQYIQENLNRDEVKFIDVGTNDSTRTDYPLFTLPVCLEVLQGSADLGILICGSGTGMAIAANRFAFIYAGVAWNEQVAKLNKEHDNVNVLILPADFITVEQSVKIINAWLDASFKGDRYKLRLDMIDAITSGDEEVGKLRGGCC